MAGVEYWVYVDVPTKRILLHKSICGACRGGTGMHGHQQPGVCWWQGPFASCQDAWRYAESEGNRKGRAPRACGLCHP